MWIFPCDSDDSSLNPKVNAERHRQLVGEHASAIYACKLADAAISFDFFEFQIFHIAAHLVWLPFMTMLNEQMNESTTR